VHLRYGLRKNEENGGNMKKLSFYIALFTALALSNPRGAQAGDYPEKLVQIIEDSAAGSTPDVALRFVADELSKLWGQQVLVISHPGAGGSVAARVASTAAPDGYTLYQPVSSTFVALHPAAPNVPLQVPRDFLPIGFVSENPMFIAASPSLGLKTLPQLLELAKKRPGEISWSWSPTSAVLRRRSATSRPDAWASSLRDIPGSPAQYDPAR
jgi:tripartite-type tricarboxylate transporter receptor subunit TctC